VYPRGALKDGRVARSNVDVVGVPALAVTASSNTDRATSQDIDRSSVKGDEERDGDDRAGMEDGGDGDASANWQGGKVSGSCSFLFLEKSLLECDDAAINAGAGDVAEDCAGLVLSGERGERAEPFNWWSGAPKG
jgi:hypothetical protein